MQNDGERDLHSVKALMLGEEEKNAPLWSGSCGGLFQLLHAETVFVRSIICKKYELQCSPLNNSH